MYPLIIDGHATLNVVDCIFCITIAEDITECYDWFLFGIRRWCSFEVKALCSRIDFFLPVSDDRFAVDLHWAEVMHIVRYCRARTPR